MPIKFVGKFKVLPGGTQQLGTAALLEVDDILYIAQDKHNLNRGGLLIGGLGVLGGAQGFISVNGGTDLAATGRLHGYSPGGDPGVDYVLMLKLDESGAKRRIHIVAIKASWDEGSEDSGGEWDGEEG